MTAFSLPALFSFNFKRPLLQFGSLMFLGLLLFSLGCQADKSETSIEKSDNQERQVPATPEALVRAYTLQIEESPKDYALYESRSQAYYEMDSVDASIRDIEQAIALYREGPELHFWRGFLAYGRNDTARAMQEYKAAIGLGSSNPEVFYQLGQVYFLQQQDQAAIRNYQEASKLAPIEPLYVFAQGFLEEQRRRYSQAIPLYIESLDIDSSFAKSLLRLHDVYLQHYQSETEAMKYNEQLLRAFPTHPLGQFNLGSFHLRQAIEILNQAELPTFQAHVNDAVVAFTITVNKDPAFVQAWYNRGYCYWLGDGQESRAIEDFQKVIDLDPDHASGHFMLGSIFEKNGDLQTALSHYREASRIQPQSADFQRAANEVSAKIGS